MEKKKRKERKVGGGSRRDEQKVKDRLHSTPTSRGKVEGIEHKGSPTL